MIFYCNGFDVKGLFGCFGGQYVVEILMLLIFDFVCEYEKVKDDLVFQEELVYFQCDYVGWLSLFYFVECLIEYCGGVKIYFKCEELNYIGVYKINNCIGQIFLVWCMGKKCIIVEIGVGMYGVVIVIVVVCFGLQCVIYMGIIDIDWQQVNVFCMKLLGVEVILVIIGIGILKDVMNEVLCDWVINVDSIFYLIGMVVGLYLYLVMVCDFQVVIGKEICE